MLAGMKRMVSILQRQLEDWDNVRHEDVLFWERGSMELYEMFVV